MDTNAAAADFPAVEHHVVRLGKHAAGVALQPWPIFVARAGEGMVHGLPASFVVVVLQQREVDHPAVGQHGRVDETGALADLQAQVGETLVDGRKLVGHNQDQVAHRGAAASDDRSDLGRRQELGHLAAQALGRVDTVGARLARHADPDQPLGAVVLDEVGQLVDLAAREGIAAGEDHTLDRTAARHRALEDGEVALRHHVADVEKLQAEAQVGPVDAVLLHSLGIADDREGQRLDLLVRQHHPAQLDEHLLDDGADVGRIDKAHFQVELRELGLAVGAQVLVAETACDLEVALDAGDHEQLLELLRALRQRIELAGLQAAGHDKVARAFGRALEQNRRLDLQEVAVGEVLANETDDLVAQHQILRHARPADVEIAVLEPQHLVDLIGRARNVEGRVLGRVEDRHLVGDHLDVAGGEIGVAQTFGARRHLALDLHDELAARLRRNVVRRSLVAVDGDLRQSKAVAQVDEDERAVVAAAVDPAGQRDHLADMGSI